MFPSIIYIYIYMIERVCIYIYIEREREKEMFVHHKLRSSEGHGSQQERVVHKRLLEGPRSLG